MVGGGIRKVGVGGGLGSKELGLGGGVGGEGSGGVVVGRAGIGGLALRGLTSGS